MGECERTRSAGARWDVAERVAAAHVGGVARLERCRSGRGGGYLAGEPALESAQDRHSFVTAVRRDVVEGEGVVRTWRWINDKGHIDEGEFALL